MMRELKITSCMKLFLMGIRDSPIVVVVIIEVDTGDAFLQEGKDLYNNSQALIFLSSMKIHIYKGLNMTILQ